MSDAKQVYGRTKDGRMTPCRAKDPTKCPYHVHDYPHVKMTEQQAEKMNEALAAESAMRSNPLSKSNGYASDFTEYLDEAAPRNKVVSFDEGIAGDWAGFQRDVTSALWNTRNQRDAREKALRENDPSSLGAFTYADAGRLKSLKQQYDGDVVQAELAYMKDYENGYPDYRGMRLNEDSADNVLDAIRDVNSTHDEDTDTPSPLQEVLTGTLAYAPNISEMSNHKMVLIQDRKNMQSASRIIANSPYFTDSEKTQAFNSGPLSALGSPALPASAVNQMFTDDNPYTRSGDPVDGRAVLAALHHPNADPDTAYDYVKNRLNANDSNIVDMMKWNLSMNPNQEFVQTIRERADADDIEMIIDDPNGNNSDDWSAFMD